MIRILLLLTATVLTACGVGFAQTANVDILDFGRAFYFAGKSDVNHLLIEIESRMKLDGEEYLLLAPHPREETFENDGRAYSAVIEDAQGASEITFMLTRSGNHSVVTRRYDVPGQPPEFLHSVGLSPYGPLLYDPAKARQDGIAEIHNLDGLMAAARRGHQILGIVEYVIGGKSVSIDFPVKVLNMNVDPAPPGQQWQAASGRIPLFIPDPTNPTKSITNGHVAFSMLGTATLQFVYLCEATQPRATQDFTCTVNYDGSVRLYERL